MIDTEFDVIVVGAGSGGVSLAQSMTSHGRSVAIIADGYVGGECPYVACMPSKSLLRSARARTEARAIVEHGGASSPVHLDEDNEAWQQAVVRRDETSNDRDDSEHAQSLQDDGITVVRGFGRITGPGTVEVDGREFHARDVVIDTGSVAAIPDIDGLDDVPVWTSDQALSSPERPARMIILGGGPIGCELGQAYATFGTHVTIVDTADRLLPSEDPPLSDLMLTVEQESGVEVLFGTTPTRAEKDGNGLRLTLDDGRTLTADRLLVVVGRTPATDGLGAESAGATLSDDGSIEVDDVCRAADRLWAIGDVTGVAPYTHTANHQARVAADAILGRTGHAMTPDALPRAVFTEPPLAGTGLTEAQARDRGLHVVVAEADLSEVSRAGAEGAGPLGPADASGGLLRLIADVDSGRLVGAAAIGPHADEWIGEATLAIRASVPLDVLTDLVRPFPTYSEAYTLAYDSLRDELDRAATTSTA